MTTAVAVVNRSLEMIGAQTTIIALNDGTVAGDAAGVVYTPTVYLLLRQLGPAFSRRAVALVPSGATPPLPWTQSYNYPADCLHDEAWRETER